MLLLFSFITETLLETLIVTAQPQTTPVPPHTKATAQHFSPVAFRIGACTQAPTTYQLLLSACTQYLSRY